MAFSGLLLSANNCPLWVAFSRSTFNLAHILCQLCLSSASSSRSLILLYPNYISESGRSNRREKTRTARTIARSTNPALSFQGLFTARDTGCILVEQRCDGDDCVKRPHIV